MQVKRKDSTEGFKPFSIVIEVESELERQALQEMVVWDNSIPSLISDPKEREVIENFIKLLQKQLPY